MIQITFENQPSNIGSIQQFETKEQLSAWCSEHSELLGDIKIDANALTITPGYGKIEEGIFNADGVKQ